MIALTALGNRAWGSGIITHWAGALMMAEGIWLSHPIPSVVQFILLFMAIYFWRMFTSAPWLNLESDTDWESAILRGIPMLPLIVLRTYQQHSVMPILIGLLVAMVCIPAIYYLSGRQKRCDATALAEFVCGAYMGII